MKKLLLLSVPILFSAFMLISCDKSDNTDNQSDSKTIPEGYVDLGLPSGTLWKAANESNEDGFFTYDEAVSQFGSQLPTKEQWEELVEYCDWTWRDSQGDFKVTGPSGRFIFLPAAGRYFGEGTVIRVGLSGHYWSSTPDGSLDAWFLCFVSLGMYLDPADRCLSKSVRLVQNK